MRYRGRRELLKATPTTKPPGVCVDPGTLGREDGRGHVFPSGLVGFFRGREEVLICLEFATFSSPLPSIRFHPLQGFCGWVGGAKM